MSRRRRVLVSAVAGTLVLLGLVAMGEALGGAGTAAKATSLEQVDRQAPELAGSTIDGSRADLAQLRGKVVLVNVWASWCAPCRQELPLLASTQQRLGSKHVVLLGLLTRDEPAAARQLLRDLRVTGFPSVYDPDGATAVAWGITGVPETFVVDRQGRIRARCVGPLTQEWIASQVDPLVAA